MASMQTTRVDKEKIFNDSAIKGEEEEEEEVNCQKMEKRKGEKA